MDTIRKAKLQFYDYIPQNKPEWSFKYRNKLKLAVMKDARRLLKLPLIQRISFLEEKLQIYLEGGGGGGTKKILKQIESELGVNKIKCKEIEK